MTDVLPADLLSRVRQSHKREEGYVAAGKKKTICSSLLSVLGVCVCVWCLWCTALRCTGADVGG